MTQGTGYIGDYNSQRTEFLSVRDESRIPDPLKRREVGTDIYIPAYKATDGWEKDLLFSILNNFWPAIHFKKIKFRVGAHTINHANLKDWIEKFADEEGFDAKCYYMALTYPASKYFETELTGLGRVKLHLVLGNGENKKRVALIRRNAMVVDYWDFRPPKAFSGLFICDNEEGNELLRKMEPPRHDKFDPDRLDGGKTILTVARNWIRDCINTLMPQASGSRFELDDVSRFLPDEEDRDEADLSGEEPQDKESLIRVPAPTVKTIVKVLPPTVADEGGVADEGSGSAGAGAGEPNPKGGDGKNTGGRVGQSGGEEPAAGKIRNDIHCRAVHFGSAKYLLILRANAEFDGRVTLQAVGDDGGEDRVNIISVDDADDGVEIIRGAIRLRIPIGKPKKMTVTLDVKDRLSLKGVAHEG